MADSAIFDRLDHAIDAMLAGDRQAGAGDGALSGLIEIADMLRDMPDDRFKTQLRQKVQTGFVAINAITPFICHPDADKLIEFMKYVFGAKETSRHPHHGPRGFVANMRIGDSDVLIMGGEAMRGQETSAALHVYVKDCDAVYERALSAGAVTIGIPGAGEPADRPYGERAAFLSDPLGNYWFIATRFGPDHVGVGLRHVTPTLTPVKAAPLIDFLERAFGARVEGRRELAGRLIHAFVRIGGVMVEMAEWDESARPFAFYIYTDDVDAVYDRAIDAGAVTLLAPAEQPFGGRLAIIMDPAGNRWLATSAGESIL